MKAKFVHLSSNKQVSSSYLWFGMQSDFLPFHIKSSLIDCLKKQKGFLNSPKIPDLVWREEDQCWTINQYGNLTYQTVMKLFYQKNLSFIHTWSNRTHIAVFKGDRWRWFWGRGEKGKKAQERENYWLIFLHVNDF